MTVAENNHAGVIGTSSNLHGNLRYVYPQGHVYPQEIAGPNKALLRETNG